MPAHSTEKTFLPISALDTPRKHSLASHSAALQQHLHISLPTKRHHDVPVATFSGAMAETEVA